MSDIIPYDRTPRGLVMFRPPTFSEWIGLLDSLRVEHEAMPWVVGDAVNYGDAMFGEKASQAYDAVEGTGWTPKTLGVYSWVCRRIPPERRRTDLSFAHHQLVAALEPEQQAHWLSQAASDEDGVWSTRELASAIKKADGKPTDIWVVVKATDAHDAEWLVGQLEAQGRIAKVK